MPYCFLGFYFYTLMLLNTAFYLIQVTSSLLGLVNFIFPFVEILPCCTSLDIVIFSEGFTSLNLSLDINPLKDLCY